MEDKYAPNGSHCRGSCEVGGGASPRDEGCQGITKSCPGWSQARSCQRLGIKGTRLLQEPRSPPEAAAQGGARNQGSGPLPGEQAGTCASWKRRVKGIRRHSRVTRGSCGLPGAGGGVVPSSGVLGQRLRKK